MCSKERESEQEEASGSVLAFAGKPRAAAMPAYERVALLRRVGQLLVKRVDPIAEIMARETGKAIKDLPLAKPGADAT
jgi:acyl-CoA reductase-like NAD-dependent aldehyde dehydrogenase